MPRRRLVWCAVVCGVVVGLGGPGSLAQERDGETASAGALEKIDALRLHEMMRSFSMWEMVDHHSAAIKKQGGLAVKIITIKTLRAKALDPATPPAQRRAMLNEAINLQLKVIEEFGKKADTKQGKIALLDQQFLLVEIAGLDRVQDPYGLNMMYLRGTADERATIVTLTTRAVRLLDQVSDTARDYLAEWNTLDDQVDSRPALEQLQFRLLQQGAWVYLYRGLALSSGSDRTFCLTQAQSMASECLQRGWAKHRSLLIIGAASLGLGRYDPALKNLQAVDVAEAPVGVRVQALFMIPQALAGKSEYTEAMKAANAFYEKAVKLTDERMKVAHGVSAALLRSEVYDAAASRQTDQAKAAGYRKEAMKVLVDFISDHAGDAGVQMALFEIIVRKYGKGISLEEPATLKAANPIVLMALAVGNHGVWGQDMPETQRMLLLKGPQKALEELLSRTDSVSVKMRPDAMWYLAKIQALRLQTGLSARLHAEIAQKHPDHKLAPVAALNAVRQYAGLIQERTKATDEKKEAVSPNLRREYVAAMETLLNNAKWVEAARKLEKIEGRYFDLGWQLYKLVEITGDSPEKAKEKSDLQRRAIEAFRKVPRTEIRPYMAGHHLGLWMEVDHLDARQGTKTPPGHGESREVVGRLKAYSEDAKTEAARASAEAAKAAAAGDAAKAKEAEDFAKDLSEWGAHAAYNVATVTYNHLEETGSALAQLKALPEQWPNTSVIEASMEFRIRKLIEQGMTDEAGEEVKKFHELFRERSGQLIPLVIANIQKAIKKLQASLAPDKEVKLRAYRAGYSKFAKLLYDDVVKDPKDPKYDKLLLLSRKQLYGDALVGTGKGAEALKLFQECRKDQDAENEVKKKEIETKYKDRHELAKTAAETSAKALQDVVIKVLAELTEEFKKESYAARELVRISAHLGKLLGAGGGAASAPASGATSAPATEDLKRAVALTLKSHQKLMDRLAKAEKDDLPVDMTTLWGLGKSYELLKKYAEALKAYRRLADGIEDRFPKQYWQAELAYCRCALEAYREDKQKLEELQFYVEGLQKKDKFFGGEYPRFNAIKAQIRQLLDR